MFFVLNFTRIGKKNLTHNPTARPPSFPSPLQVTASAPGGFEGLWPAGPRNGRYGPQHTQFVAPSFMRHTLDAYDKLGFKTLTVVYAVPVAPGRCRLIARFPFKFKSALPRFFFSVMPRWANHPSQMSILEDDQIFLHIQEREIAERAIEKGTTG
jgi:hypothetical protein